MRRFRPWLVAACCVLAALAAVTAVLWRQGDFWRESAANYLRERLSAEFGAQFQTGDLRGTWLPPGLSLGRVTFHRDGEPWVLTAEDVRISFNPYAVLFGRERLGRLVIDRPRLFLRAGAVRGAVPVAPDAAGPQLPAAALAPAVAERLRSLLRPPFPLRVLDVVDGRVEVADRTGGRTVADGVNLSVLVSSGKARVLLEIGSLVTERPGRRAELGRVDAAATLAEGQITVREIVASGGPVTGTFHGTADYEGALALQGRLSARIDAVAALGGRPGAATGTAVFDGEITGSWRDPSGAGSIAVRDLAVGGRRWPQAQGRIGWGGGRLFWSQVRLPVGEGAVTAAGEADFSGGEPRYVLDAEARAVDLARLPVAWGAGAAQVLGLSGTLHWEGSGAGAAARGSGRLAMRFASASWPGEEVTLETAAALEGGLVAVRSLRGATRSVEFVGDGLWSPGAGLAGRITGAVGDLRRLFPAAQPALGGSGSFEGDFALAAGGPRFSGSLRVSQVTVGDVRGIEGSVRVAAASGTVRLVDGAAAWPGGRGGFNGTIAVPSGELDLAAVVEELSFAAAARLFGAGSQPLGGTLGARLNVRGTATAPEVEGTFTGNALSYRAVTLDAATLSLTYAARRLGVTRLLLRRGTTELLFRGELREGRVVEGEFEGPSFDLADFRPGGGIELAGSLRGRLRGTLDDPLVEGSVSAKRLRWAGFDFKGGELAIGFRKGVAAVEGWVAARENRLRLVLEPSRDWRFDSDLELRQLASEMVRSGLGGLPPGLARALGKASFLATGRLQVSGRLRDAASVRADLRLDTLWLQAAGTTLQNLAPVRISWRDAGLAVEDFRIAGEQYHLEVRGGGSLAAGWNLQAEGSVNIAGFTEYWPEIEEAAGSGDLRLTLGGPWDTPLPEGTLTVREAFVRVRSLPEPLEHLEGRLELLGRTLTATGLSGTIGGGAFRGGGSYQLAQDRLDAQVEGRLDLALFRARLPLARELRGPVEVKLQMAGALAAPVFSGEVEVLDAEMFLRPFPAKITHLSGTVLVAAERLEVRELAGRTGGGTVRLTGTMDWSRSPVRVDADLEGRGILVSLAGALKAQSDLRLGLHGDFQDLKLSGEVRILKARYTREFGERLPSLEQAAGAPAAPAAGGADLSRMALDVKVTAADNVWIANRMAKVETAVALAIGGRLGAPVVRGEISAIQGEAFYLSRQFRLESGTLRFVPPAKVPLLDLQASTSVGETQILFLMDGPLNKLSYHLTSLPAMTQQDLVSLLTIGETRSGLARQGERASTVGAAVFTSEPLVNALGEEARSAMGLEVLQVEPVIGVNDQVSARVTLGTHLSDRVFVSYSQNLGATEDQQVAVQYSMLDYLSIWGQELRQGVFSLDLVFRYAFK